MKNARTKFAVALVLFIISLGCGVLLISYVSGHISGRSSPSRTFSAEADGYVLGVILFQVVTTGTFISYLRESRKSQESQKRDGFLRFVSWLFILAGIVLTLLHVLLLFLLNG